MLDYLNELREGCLEAYTGIIQVEANKEKILFKLTFAGLERGRISPCSRACHCPASRCLHCAVYHRCCPGLGSTENSLNCFAFTFNVQDSEHSDASVAASAGLIGDLCSAFGGGKMDGDRLCTDI